MFARRAGAWAVVTGGVAIAFRFGRRFGMLGSGQAGEGFGEVRAVSNEGGVRLGSGRGYGHRGQGRCGAPPPFPFSGSLRGDGPAHPPVRGMLPRRTADLPQACLDP